MPGEAMVEREDFRTFFERERDGLFGALVLITGNRHEAEEIAQDAFLALWERWGRVRSLEDPTGYLYRTAMNEFRMRRRQAVVAARRALGRIPGPNAFDAVDARDALDRALASISSRQRAAIILTDLLGYSSDEAGRMLRIRPTTVRVLASQARLAIRRVLGDGNE